MQDPLDYYYRSSQISIRNSAFGIVIERTGNTEKYHTDNLQNYIFPPVLYIFLWFQL